MSHYLSMTCAVITDVQALVEALVRMGIDRKAIEVHDKPVTLEGYNDETRKANVIVRKSWIQNHQQQCGMCGYGVERNAGRAYADMGFIKQADGTYTAMVDDHNFNEEWVKKMSTYYNVEKSKAELTKRKIIFKESLVKGLPTITANIPFRKQQTDLTERRAIFN